MTVKISELPVTQKLGNTGAAPNAARSWDFAYTWNAAGTTFTAMYLNITNTASAAGSLIADWQVGGVSMFSVGKAGAGTFAGTVTCAGLGLASGNTIAWNSDTGLARDAAGVVEINNGTAGTYRDLKLRYLIADTNASSATPSIQLGASNSGITYFNSGVLSLVGGALASHMQSNKFKMGSNGQIGFTSSSGDPTASISTCFGRAGTNFMVYGGSASAAVAGGAISFVKGQKEVTAIADATPTDVLTITVPNASHSAMVKVTLVGKLGAGGAIGAGEATGTVSYDIALARTAGVNAVAGISAAYGSATASVAGGATITVSAALSAVSGAVGATNTFTVQITITRGSGSSTNHTCEVYARLINANASGITIA